ncbi:MAG: nucleotidyltransferase [Thermoprotei archaeon]
MISFVDVGKVLEVIRQNLGDFVIIGDTVVDLALNKKGTESDVDLFPLEISSFAEEDKIREFAYSQGWDYGKTPIDTPRVIATVGEQELQIDFYDNIQDFYVPQVILESATLERIGTSKFKVVRLEDYILLKLNAYREEDEDELRGIVELIGSGKLKIDKQYLASHIDYFEENSQSIRDRLKSIGLPI